MRAALRETLLRADRALERGERAILAVGVLGIALLGIANVVARNFLGGSLAFSEELNQILVVAVTFLGLGHGVREGRHIRMSAFYDLSRGRPRKALLVVTWLGTALLLGWLTVLAVDYVAGMRAMGSVTPALRIPWWVVYAAVPLGLGVASLQYALGAAANLWRDGIHLSLRREETYDAVPGGAGEEQARGDETRW